MRERLTAPRRGGIIQSSLTRATSAANPSPVSSIQTLPKHKETFFSSSLKSPVVVVGHSLHQVHFGPRHAADGPVPVVPDPHVQISGVEVLEILVEGHKVLHVDKDRGQLAGSSLPPGTACSRTSLSQVITENICGKSSQSSYFPAVSFPQHDRALRNNGPNRRPQKTT